MLLKNLINTPAIGKRKIQVKGLAINSKISRIKNPLPIKKKAQAPKSCNQIQECKLCSYKKVRYKELRSFLNKAINCRSTKIIINRY